MISFPLNDILYDAEAVQLFCATRDTGIYASDDFRCTVKGNDNKVTVEAGMGWCRFDRYRGCAFALKEAQTVDLGIADENLPRIDAVGVKYFSNGNKFDLFVEKGTPASKPIAPTIDKSLGVILCLVDRPASTSIITQDLITDVRLNTDYCGLMADAITKVDTVAIDQQITKFINDLKQGSAFIPAEAVANYIIEEQRIGEYGIVRKYLNGDMEYIDYTAVKPVYAGWGHYHYKYVLEFPVPFVNKPIVFVNGAGVDKRHYPYNQMTGGFEKDYLTNTSVMLEITFDEPSDFNEVHYFAIHCTGRWK